MKIIFKVEIDADGDALDLDKLKTFLEVIKEHVEEYLYREMPIDSSAKATTEVVQ